MPELLLELLSEEIPARMQARAAEDLKRLVTDGLGKAGLTFDSARAYVTPRRLALVVDGLPARQPDVKEERKGPRVGAPEQAIQGFLKSAGLSSLDQCEVREVKGNQFHFAVTEKKGGETLDAVIDAVRAVARNLPWPKSMRWADGEQTYVRPLHRALLCFGTKKTDGAIDFGGHVVVPTDRKTVGHRFLAPKAFTVKSFADYKAKLEAAYVVLDPAERRERIRKQANALAKRRKLAVKEDEALLDEVTGLVEWPVALIGRIDAEFMELPPEVLVTSMRSHQKYFSLLDADGAMAPFFITVANMETADKGKAIVAGNERVLRARLADAKFFWDQDRKTSLSSRIPALNGITFHAKLGTLGDKIDRVGPLAVEIAGHIEGADKDRVRSAARLAKADLTTGMVGEFPDLQGVMGRYYASHDGEHEDVAGAIAEHYSPLGPNDACPTAPVSVAVALADKIDTLAGFWAIGEKPTGSKDPYALRRAALGVIRLILENGLRLPLMLYFQLADRLVAEIGRGVTGAFDPQDLLGFFADRLKVHLRERGVRHDLISAVFELGGEDDLVRLLTRVDALGAFLDTQDGANLLVAYRRAANIVRIEEKRDGMSHAGAPEPARFAQPEESALGEALNEARTDMNDALQNERFNEAMTHLAELRGPVDTFFDTVTVNTEDPALRENRLRLLSRIKATMDTVADFSKIEG